MRIEDFGEFKTGTLVPITLPLSRGNDWAFVPRPLPPPLRLSDELWFLVMDATRAIGELNGGSDGILNPRLLLPPLQQNEAIESSKIEGTYLTPQQLLLAFDNSPDADAQANAAWREVNNYYRALRAGYDELADGKVINCELIKRLHRTLMTGVRGEDNHPGEFRGKQAFVGSPENRTRFVPPPPNELEGCLTLFDECLQYAEDKIPPLVRAFVVHYQFEAIHPFSDGNGRMGRLLLSLTIHHWLKLDLPWLYLSEYFHATRDEYIRHLYEVSTAGRWDSWIEYCLKGAIQQAWRSIKRLKDLGKLRAKYRGELKNEKRLPEIVEKLFSWPVVRVVEIEKDYGVTYDTARSDVAKLEERGILREVEGFRPKAFAAMEICEIAYCESSKKK